MNWTIKYTDKAELELENIYYYISDVLLEPVIAKNMIKLITKEIRSLETMPGRYRIYEDEPWHSEDLRVLPVKKYLVFYFINEDERIVEIVRIMYGGRDIKNQLNEMN